jgi:hypothetical protein
MKYIEWTIDEEAEQRGISAISLVEHPAIESDWVTLSKQEKPLKFAAQDNERQIVMGAALIPRKQILRVDDEGNEYYGFFSEETVRRGMELFMMDGNIKQHTFEHQEVVNGCVVVESWIVDDSKNDKSTLYGFSVPKGTWMVSIKVNNATIWNEFVKTGIVKGFSIEGYFTDNTNKSKATPLSIVEDQTKMKKTVFEKVVSKIKQEMFGKVELAEATLADGSVIYTPAEAFAAGVEVQVDIDGEMQPAADGEYELESGEILVVAGGVVADILTKEDEMSEEDVQAQLSEIITNAVAEATKGLNEKIESLTADMETLKAEKAKVETELSEVKKVATKTPAKVIPRKEELSAQGYVKPLPNGMQKSFEKFKQYTK